MNRPFEADEVDTELDLVPEQDGDAVETRRGSIEADGHGERLDKALVRLVPEFSRNHLQTLLAEGHVRLDGQRIDGASRRVKAGQRLEVDLQPTAESRAFRAEPMALDIVFEDAHLMVLNKPAGRVVHPAAGHWSGTVLNGLLHHHAASAALPRAGIVHRLDKDTSGLMVVGKTLAAVTALVRAIAAREVHRQYLALAHGTVRQAEQTIDAPIGRDPKSRVRMAVVGSGKPARTDVECLAVQAQVSALRCTLHTGRTHQIRVHLASKGHPLVADMLYGGRLALGLQRQALHATALAFEHPITGQALSFRCPLPADLASAWADIAGIAA